MRHCLVIGEVAQNHDGSLGLAHAFIDAIAQSGADAVKFQVHIASAESTPEEPWRVNFSAQDETRYAYWKRMEFTEEQWSGLRKHAHECQLQFICSPFSLEAVEMANRVGIDLWKIASGEVGNTALITKVAQTGLPVFVSSGMSSLEEIRVAVETIRKEKGDLTLLQCTSNYPCPPEKIGLNMLPLFKERFGCPVGLSDHSGTIYPGLAAMAFGIEALEVHVTFSREMFGPDISSSITLFELKQLVEGVRFLEKAFSHPVDKDKLAEELDSLRVLFTKSVVARSDLPVGSILSEKDLALKKPAKGIPASRLQDLIGRSLTRPIKENQFLNYEDVEPILLPRPSSKNA